MAMVGITRPSTPGIHVLTGISDHTTIYYILVGFRCVVPFSALRVYEMVLHYPSGTYTKYGTVQDDQDLLRQLMAMRKIRILCICESLQVWILKKFGRRYLLAIRLAIFKGIQILLNT